MIATGISFHDARIDREPFALDKPGIHARPDHRLEQLSKDVAVTEAAMAIDRERRVVRHLVVEIEAAEPPIRKMKLDLLAQLALEADAIAVADDEHPQHELGIDRRAADLAVERLQLLPNIGQHARHHRIDAAEEMTRRDALFQIKKVKQLALIARLPSHHGKPPSLKGSPRRNHGSPIITSPFSTASTRGGPHKRSSVSAPKDYHPYHVRRHAR